MISEKTLAEWERLCDDPSAILGHGPVVFLRPRQLRALIAEIRRLRHYEKLFDNRRGDVYYKGAK